MNHMDTYMENEYEILTASSNFCLGLRIRLSFSCYTNSLLYSYLHGFWRKRKNST